QLKSPFYNPFILNLFVMTYKLPKGFIYGTFSQSSSASLTDLSFDQTSHSSGIRSEYFAILDVIHVKNTP
ncbi:MAG: hypothetical protein ACFFGP_14885, partial [Promethearchaeota archaeon]